MFKKPSSAPTEIIKLVGEGVIVPLISQEIISEYRQVLSRPKFSFPKNAVDDFIDAFLEVGEVIDNAEDTTISLIDPKDQAFYKVVLEKRKTNEAYLITGNLKHFPIEPFILSPRNMLNLVMNYPIQ